jgi:hypothetical protein
MTHLAAAPTTPVVHTVELLDWATGGPISGLGGGHSSACQLPTSNDCDPRLSPGALAEAAIAP